MKYSPLSINFTHQLRKLTAGLLLVTMVFLAGCADKELPEPTIEPPTLFVSGFLEGHPIDLQVNQGMAEAWAIPVNYQSGIPSWEFNIISNDSVSKLWGPQEMLIVVHNYLPSLSDSLLGLENTILPGTLDYSFIEDFDSFSTVKIIYSDAQGGFYFSELVDGQGGSFFEIQEVREVEMNGRIYREALISFECRMLNVATGKIAKLTSGQGIVSFGGVSSR